MFRHSVQLPSENDTVALAQSLCVELGAGDVILLRGDIGTGKTTLARAIIQSLLSEPEDVPSPTFTIVQQYDATDFEIWHADLYRLTNPDEVVELGLYDAFETALCLVEWPDRLGDDTPASSLDIQLAVDGSGRQVTMSATDDRWAPVFKAITEHA